MANESAKNEMNSMLFSSLVMMLTNSCMQSLGKLVDPSIGKTAVNLNAAQMMIDLLAMLQEKTKGNLDRNEAALLGGSISNLQLNYVETAENEKKNAASGNKSSDSGASAGEPPKDV